MFQNQSRQKTSFRNSWHKGTAIAGLAFATLSTGCASNSPDRNLAPTSQIWSDLTTSNNPLHTLPDHFGLDLSRGNGFPKFSGDYETDFEILNLFLGLVQTKDLCAAIATVPEISRSLWNNIEGSNLSPLKATLLVSFLASNLNETAAAHANDLACSEFMRLATDREAAQFFCILGEAYYYGHAKEVVQLACRVENGRPLLQHIDSTGHSLLANLYVLTTSEHIFEPFKLMRHRAMLDLVGLGSGSTVLDQGDRRTCGSTTMLLVMNDLPELSRLTLGLFSPEGSVPLRGGALLERTPDWDGLKDPGASFGDRGPAQALLQAAIMDLGNGPLWHYRDSVDANLLGIIPIPGLMPHDARRCLEELTGVPQEVTHDFDTWLNVQRSFDFGERTPVVIHFGGLSFHWLAVEQIVGGEVYLCDPNGVSISMMDGLSNRYDNFPMNAVIDSNNNVIFGKFRVPVESFRDKFFCALIPEAPAPDGMR